MSTERVELETIIPPEPLRPFVRRYLYANRDLRSASIYQARPTGYAYFCNLFERDGGEYRIGNGAEHEHKWRWSLLGQTTDQDIAFRHESSIHLLVAELAATAHHRLFGIDGPRVLGLTAALEEAAPKAVPLARECFVLGAGGSRAEHVAEANAFFTRLAEDALPADPIVEEAVRLLEASDGAMRIANLCRRLAIDPRSLNRRFRRIVGISPKFFSQVMRINRVVDLLYAAADAELAQVAQAAGFYDQPHLNHAMRRFFQEGPREFLRSEHDAYRSFLAESRRFGRPRLGPIS